MRGKMISTMESAVFLAGEAGLPSSRETCLVFAPSILRFDHLQKERGEGQLFLLAVLLMGD